MAQPIQAPPAQPTADSDGDPRNLHDLALDIQTDLHKLAVGLAHEGAAPEAVAQLTKMAEVIGNVTKVLAAGGGQPAPGPQAGPPQGQPAPGPQAAPPSAPVAAAAPPATEPHASLAAASHHLHNAMVASAQQRLQK